MRYCVVLLLLAAAACGGAPVAPTTPTTEAPAQPAATSRGVDADMTAVDLEGRPLSGMMPIATLRPNAFDEPVARGTLTDGRGHSAFLVPRGQRLFLRAWDPQLRYFPNNFYEMPAAEGTYVAPMTISMVPAARIEARLVDVQGRSLANTVVDLMLSHPTQGPWWPSQARTDIAGQIRFTPVPPGEYLIEVKAQGVGQASIGKTFLPPAKNTPLGDITLK